MRSAERHVCAQRLAFCFFSRFDRGGFFALGRSARGFSYRLHQSFYGSITAASTAAYGETIGNVLSHLYERLKKEKEEESG